MIEELKKRADLIMGKADKTLADADILLRASSYFGSVNRSYYAAFYAAKALLALKQLDSSKHSGILSLFNLNFIKTGIISKDLGKIFNQLFEARAEGDYLDEKLFTKQEAEDILIKSQTFVEGIKRAINKLAQKNQ